MHRRHALSGLLGAAFVVLASGCGQKGPLFLPSEKIDEIERKRREKRSSGRAPDGGTPTSASG